MGQLNWMKAAGWGILVETGKSHYFTSANLGDYPTTLCGRVTSSDVYPESEFFTDPDLTKPLEAKRCLNCVAVCKRIGVL
jgi:hypothetical protein